MDVLDRSCTNYSNTIGWDNSKMCASSKTSRPVRSIAIKWQPKGFAFIRFPTLAEAESFMETNYPTIYIYGDSSKGNASQDVKVRLAYGRERKDTDRTQEADWTCRICNVNNFSTRPKCFRCNTVKPDPIVAGKTSNIGDNDAAPDNVPSQFLLLRGLEPSVSEELLAKGVAKLNKPSSTDAQPVQQTQKKSKVVSTTGDSNLGAREGTLRRVLLIRDRKTNDSWRYGFAEYASIEDAQAALTRYNSFDRFTIASKQVLVSYIHAGVFVPVHNPSAATERFTFSPLGNPTIKLQYWDEEAYVTELTVSAPEPTTIPRKARADAQQGGEGLKQIPDLDKLKKRKQQLEATANSSSKKATPSRLQFWSNRHAELHGIQHKSAGSQAASETSESAAPTKSFADLNRNCCYLCMRQFNDAAEVNKHERLSNLHRANLQDNVKVKRAEHKLEKHGMTPPVRPQAAAALEADDQKPEYRDRAKERRKIYGVVNKKGEQLSSSATSVKEQPPSPPPAASKGANLLAKMGYTSGTGLGASGEGMTAPINQNVYAAGVGLGAQGGKLGDAVEAAERNTKGDYGDWVAQGKERMKERFNNM
ncbi:hypothetical protein PMZ80_007396 [Knufia obscura]|uniref:RNA-binding protein n=1 Tax=Knufia obscura TaxID=1635080 RepID=A0ABR0RI78_9EURO|nr:hypothetical protein PMZ80_007396 [Knufia obscura]